MALLLLANGKLFVQTQFSRDATCPRCFGGPTPLRPTSFLFKLANFLFKLAELCETPPLLPPPTPSTPPKSESRLAECSERAERLATARPGAVMCCLMRIGLGSSSARFEIIATLCMCSASEVG